MPHRNTHALDQLQKSLHTLTENGKKHPHIIPTGDFNCPDIDWTTHTLRNRDFFFFFLSIAFHTWRPALEIKCVVRWRESSGPYSLLCRVSGTGQTSFLRSWWFLHSSST